MTAQAPLRAPLQGDLALAERQLRAIDAFNSARAAAEAAAAAVGPTRELRLDHARHLDALRRQHEALVRRTHEQLCQSGQVLGLTVPVRAVVAHRNAWFTDRLVGLWRAEQVQVVARVDNGADAIGIVVAEQPDLLFLEESLLMVPGEEVVREARRYCEGLRITVQAGGGERVRALLDAGADQVVTRQASPAEIVEQLGR